MMTLMIERLAALQQGFVILYGAGPVHFLRAPARINILGEHVDYVSYLPTASLTFGSQQHAMLMAYRPNAEGKVRGASTHAAYQPFELGLHTTELNAAASWAMSWKNYVFERAAPAPHWCNYVEGAVRYAQWQHGASLTQGFDFLVDSTIPACGGSSSSSALTCLVGAALRAVNGLAFTMHELAMDSSRAEWFVGTRGGAMDHQTICLSQPGAAVLIHHDSQLYNKQLAETVALPGTGYAWVTFFSHEADKGRGVMLEYNARAAVSRLVIPALFGGVPADLPATITLAEFARRDATAFAECARLFPQLLSARRHEALPVRAYAEHHAGEIRRVAQALDWLRGESLISDNTMRKLGGLLNETHASLRDLYGISTPEVEALRELVLPEPSVYGARLRGGGFGGNVLALVREDAVAVLIEKVQAEFYAQRGRDGLAEGAVMVSTPGAGLHAVNVARQR